MYKILIVDDNPNNLYTLRSLLSKLKNCEIIEAQSGYEVLSIVLKEEIRLIILDIQMPEMDGFEVAEFLKEKESTKDIPIIFLTAVFKSEDFQQHGYELGAVDYLTKPINDNILLNKINLYLTLFDRDDKLLKTITELKEMNQRLSQLDHLKTLFIASMSHELRTPLNAIIGFSTVLKTEMAGPLNPKQKDQMERIHKAGNHLLDMVVEVLDISKVESGKFHFVPENFQLKEMLEELIDQMQPRVESKGMKIRLEIDTNIEICTDRHCLKLVIENYLINAIKYSKRGTIVITARQSAPFLEIEVSDEGIGIAPENIDTLFQPFERLESPLKVVAGGTGLGLYLTRKIVEDLMKGGVYVRSTLGQGSTFGLRIPPSPTTL